MTDKVQALDATDDPAVTHRPIRSFVLRQARMSDAQRRALDTLSRYTLPYSAALLDMATVFGRAAPCVLEIGSGMGETSAAIALAQPGTDFVAVEVHAPGVGSLLQRIEQNGIGNLRIIRHDAVEVVANMIAPASLSGIHVYFPDPWPKKRHHKRRLLKPAFVHALALRLQPAGYLHVATDWADYAHAILATLDSEPLLVNSAGQFSPRPAWRPETKFERRGINLGHAVFDALFKRRGA